jgi:terminase large subunit-like protein
MDRPLMPWQAQVANVASEIDPYSGRPAYREVRLKVPRQSGKTTLELVIELDRCLYWGRAQRVIYTAQDRNNARAKWEEQVEFLWSTQLRPALDVRRQTGAERLIVPATGSTIGITASGEASGHGFYLDLAIIDEAWAQTDERLTQAFRPAMMTRRDAQLWVVSTEGTDESVFFNERVEDGRARVEAGQRSGVAYFEWAAGDDDDPDDEETWWGCMPALGITVDIETIRDDHDQMDPADFARAYLNRRAPKGLTVVSAVAWQECRAPGSHLRSVPVFAADTTPDRSWSSIGVAGWNDHHRCQLEVVDHRPGTDWVVGRCAELVRRWTAGPVLIDPASPAGSLLVDFAAAGIATRATTSREYAQACGQLFDAVNARTICHLDQPVLNGAVSSARKRPLGDAWAWARKAGGDVSPLVAVTLARWGVVSESLIPAVW